MCVLVERLTTTALHPALWFAVKIILAAYVSSDVIYFRTAAGSPTFGLIKKVTITTQLRTIVVRLATAAKTVIFVLKHSVTTAECLLPVEHFVSATFDVVVATCTFVQDLVTANVSVRVVRFVATARTPVVFHNFISTADVSSPVVELVATTGRVVGRLWLKEFSATTAMCCLRVNFPVTTTVRVIVIRDLATTKVFVRNLRLSFHFTFAANVG